MLSSLKILAVVAVSLLLAFIAWGLVFAGFLPVVLGMVIGAAAGLALIANRRRHGGLTSNPFAPGRSGVRLNPPTQQHEKPGDRGPDGISTDVINASRIHVAGVGGLGLVAMAAAVALVLPRVGFTVTLGLVGGCLAALAVILVRRRRGPLPNTGATPGAHGLLTDQPADGGRDVARHSDTVERRQSATLVPARRTTA